MRRLIGFTILIVQLTKNLVGRPCPVSDAIWVLVLFGKPLARSINCFAPNTATDNPGSDDIKFFYRISNATKALI